MSLRINTNVAALNAYNNLSATQNKLESAFSQLSSGLRINKAADDASGLAISQGLTSQINGMTQAVSNAKDATNVAQIADGALGTVQDVLQRMRTLVVQAANTGTQDNTSLSAIQSEIGKLNEQLTNVGSQTKFGSTSLLDGSYNKKFQVGANGGETISLDLSSVDIDPTQLGSTGTKLGGTTTTTPAVAESWHDSSGTVVTQAQYDTNHSSGDGSYTHTAASPASTSTTGGLKIVSTDFTNTANSYVSADATTDLAAIDAAIKTVSTARSSIGAVQNQLNYTVTNLQTAITNVTASRSNLTDADLATQVTAMTQQQVLASAATSVLAQANSAPQAILKLLQ